jgi:hypothetical protein
LLLPNIIEMASFIRITASCLLGCTLYSNFSCTLYHAVIWNWLTHVYVNTRPLLALRLQLWCWYCNRKGNKINLKWSIGRPCAPLPRHGLDLGHAHGAISAVSTRTGLECFMQSNSVTHFLSNLVQVCLQTKAMEFSLVFSDFQVISKYSETSLDLLTIFGYVIQS